MSDQDDALREMAINRGCRLQKSRRRKPGGDFGRYGLKDARTGAEVFGFGPKGLTATADEIREFLRRGSVSDWKSSLGAGPRARRHRTPEPVQTERRKRDEAKVIQLRPHLRKAKSEDRNKDVKPGKAKPKKAKESPQPKLIVREARPKDAAAIAPLIASLGYDVEAEALRRRIAKARKRDEPVLVAERGDILGCLSWHVTPVLHRPQPVGRITMMVVSESARGEGIGAALVAAAEARLRKEGCGLIEVTTNMKRIRAHHFYEDQAFERSSYRFIKSIEE